MSTQVVRERLVADLLLCATNEGELYPRFMEMARADAAAADPCRQDYLPSAMSWTNAANDYARRYARKMVMPRANVAEVLAFAAGLSAYYAEHLAECEPA